MRFLAIDHGERRTGLAVCDASEMVVSPLMVLAGADNCVSKIANAAKEYGVEAVVIGLPYNMDGTEGPRAAQVRRFGEELKKYLALPIVFFDERLSSFAAAEKLAAMELTRKGRKKRLDAVAAAAILEGFLEARKAAISSFSGRLLRAADAESLARLALAEFLSQARQSLERSGRFTAALCGGRTPRRFFEMLGDCAEAREIDWGRVHLFWTDERAVGPADAASNYRLAEETFLKKLPIPAEQVHRMEGEAADLEAAAERYEKTLRKVFSVDEGQIPSLDLIVLGVGQDGHIASLFPGSDALGEKRLLVRVVRGPDGLNRLTLTVPVIQAADEILVLVSGAEKAPILCTLLTHSPKGSGYPAHQLWPVLHRTVWVVDSAAASLLGEFSKEAEAGGL